ncbi:MAG: 4-alpha-glucanotransferase [Bacteroidia bacterium]|nr:MAG: 4-alpha-glucanotransferase [Bacteroidia bacterium]
MNKRASGILLHISSLPGKYGIGTLGEEARKFIDFLAECGQTYWQILPIGIPGYNHSPYSSTSAFAGNPLLINPDEIPQADGKLEACFGEKKVNFEKVEQQNIPYIKRAAKIFLRDNRNLPSYIDFKNKHARWLDDFALFYAIKKKYHNCALQDFPPPLLSRLSKDLEQIQESFEEDIEIQKVIQYFFFTQWNELQNYARKKGVKIIGDLPFYIAEDSADVWTNSQIFKVDKNLRPSEKAGVPPDYFSENGQLWGNPVYDWQNLKEQHYDWWLRRMKHNLELFDIVRIDHIRALSEFWAIPGNEKTAKNGKWCSGPDDEFLKKIFQEKDKIIAEDLGDLSPEARNLIKKYQLPRMKILQFAFNSGSQNIYLPHYHEKNCVVYTGTHDNDTSCGMYAKAQEAEKDFFQKYFACNSETNESFSHRLMRTAWASVADTAIAPLQDLLELGSEHRMNTPGVAEGNWTWKFDFKDLSPKHRNFLTQITKLYDRHA